jgi:hypothetical protein
MHMNRILIHACASVFCAGMVAVSAPATAKNKIGAVVLSRHEIQNTTGICQGVLPVFDEQNRKRATGITNEGTQRTLISCSLVGDAARPTNNINVQLSNETGLTQVINCTLVSGTRFDRAYFNKSITLGPNQAGLISWTAAADNGGVGFAVPNPRCSFDPGVQFNSVERYFKEAVAR